MKNRKFIICLLIVLLSLSLISCGKSVTTTSKVAEVTTKTAKATTTTIQATTTTQEATTTTMSIEQALENFKTELKDYLNTIFGAELTKFAWDQDNKKVTIAYDTKWAVDETMKKELYDITKGIIDFSGGWIFKNSDLELSSSSKFGKIIKTYVIYDDMTKLQNLEMSYGDWLKVAFK